MQHAGLKLIDLFGVDNKPLNMGRGLNTEPRGRRQSILSAWGQPTQQAHK